MNDVLVQLSTQKHPDLPNVPLIMDFAKTPEQKQILQLVFARQAMGRPFVAPPGLPKERVAGLRSAFLAMMKDQQFLDDAKKMKLEINPVSGEKSRRWWKKPTKPPSRWQRKSPTCSGGRVAERLRARLRACLAC